MRGASAPRRSGLRGIKVPGINGRYCFYRLISIISAAYQGINNFRPARPAGRSRPPIRRSHVHQQDTSYPSHRRSFGTRHRCTARRAAWCPGPGAGAHQAALQLAPSPNRTCAPKRYKTFAAAMKDDFDFEPYWSNTLFKQGTELVALQRENLEMVQSRARRYLEADPRVVADDVGLSFPRLRSPEEDVQERRRPRFHQDGARSARHRDHPPGLFRLRARST